MTLINCIEKIFDQLKDSKLNTEKLGIIKKELRTVQKFFDCDRQTTVMLSVILMLGMEDQAINALAVVKYLGLRSTSVLEVKKMLDPLVKRNFISCRSEGNLFHRNRFEISSWLFDAIACNDKQKLKPEHIDNTIRFLQHYSYVLEERKNNSITAIDFCCWLNDFIKSHR